MAIQPSDVQAILPDEYATANVTAFITTAQLLFDEELSGKGLSADREKQIVIYLAAHFAILKLERGGLARGRLGEAEETYKQPSDFDQGLKGTRYGQGAMLLDSSGTLAALGTTALKARITVIEASQCR